MECEIKALVTLLVYDDVFLESKIPQVMTTGALGKRLKVKVKIHKYFWITRKGPQVKSQR